MEQPDFTALRNLLKLKRHEQPPPRYFNDFSSQVLNGIRNGQTGGAESAVAERMAETFGWLEQLLGVFQRKPMLAGLFGAAVCGLLLVGITYSERPEVNPAGPSLTGSQAQALSQPASVFSHDASFLRSSTNPIIPASGSLFDSLPVREPTMVSEPGHRVLNPRSP